MEDLDVLALCCPPTITTLICQQLKAYGNHYQVSSCSTHGMVNYDYGVESIFNQWCMQVHDEDVDVQYISVLKDIYLLDYDPVSSPIVLMQCEWVQNGIETRGNLTYQRDEAEFLLANFRYIMVDHEEPFIFPSQTQEVFFVDDDQNPQWKIMMRKEV
jgi:hypothetical protein